MLWAIAVIFALLWVIGIVTGTFLGGYVHLLLAVAVALLLAGAYKAGAKAGRRRGASHAPPPSHRGTP